MDGWIEAPPISFLWQLSNKSRSGIVVPDSMRDLSTCHIWLFQQKATKRCFPQFLVLTPFLMSVDFCLYWTYAGVAPLILLWKIRIKVVGRCWEHFLSVFMFILSCFSLMNCLNWWTIINSSVSTKSYPFSALICIMVINNHYISILVVSLDLKRILSEFEYSPNHFVHLNKIKRSERNIFTIVFSFLSLNN